MKTGRLLLLSVLTVTLLFSLISITSASQSKEETLASCSHFWNNQSYSPIYYYKNGSVHTVYISNYKVCSRCGQVEATSETVYDEAHSYSRYSYTGENYHSGSKHYFKYNIICVCGAYSSTPRWFSGDCPGGTHISPLTTQPVLVTE